MPAKVSIRPDHLSRDVYAPGVPSALRNFYGSPSFTPAANPTDIIAVIGTGFDRIIRVDRVVISGIADTASVIDVFLQYVADNGTGTRVNMFTGRGVGMPTYAGQADTTPGTQGQASYYTANKSSNGNGISSSRPVIASRRMQFATTTTPGSPAVFDFPRGFGPEIRDNVFSVVANLNGQTMPGNASIRVEELQVTEIRLPLVAYIGDSTFAAAQYWGWKLNEAGNLAQSCNPQSFSQSGITIANFTANGGINFPMSYCVPNRSRDVPVFGLGLNDVRLGMSEATLTGHIETFVAANYAANPKAKIVLVSPNAPASDDPTSGNFIPLTGQYAGMTLAQAAQLCADICYNAYDSFGSDPRVFKVFHRQNVLGRTVATVANSGAALGLTAPIMADQLHPNQLGQETWGAAFRPVLNAAIAARWADING